MKNTSWEKASGWYNNIVGEKGHYYHKNIIFPKLLEILQLKNQKKSLLDLGCGQGAFARNLPNSVEYCGIDIASSFIHFAKKYNKNKLHQFIVKDITKPLNMSKTNFDFVTIILALQNIENILGTLKNAFQYLKPKGEIIIVINHPCFRIPRQSMWEVDEKQNVQYRKITRYLSFLKIPILQHPGQAKSNILPSFHNPISVYSKLLKEAGFVIKEIDEWVSDKKSTGSKKRMEDKARSEFPLFMTIIGRKEDRD
jgi:ubiquinone/menaquinone biosynthesis C-methylase UbiE